ncbi:MAG: hemolysin family protein [Oscillospiraceae bacterium]|jgi:putative hemolysin|nr:hemolysin family protein [Oscillospiraceae bacterium]
MGTNPDPDPANLLLEALLLFALILVNAFFAMSEIALISLNDTKMERLAAEGNKRAKRIVKLTANSSRFLSMIQIGVTLAGFLASAAAAQNFGAPLLRAMEKRTPPGWHGVLGVAVTFFVTLVISYLSMVLGELVPKRLAMRYPEKISMRFAGLLGACAAGLRPLVWVVSASANAVLRLLGIDPNADEEALTEEEIRMLVDAGGEKGVIEEAQQEMINNIFEFDDINVGDIMTHRTEIIGVEADEPLQRVVELSIEEGCSRIPVYQDDLDNIIGVVYIKDLLKYIGTALPGGQSLRGVMREAQFVPETKRCGALFTEMTAKRIQIAIVVDEYGGTAGLVTLEDVLESIVGSIQDEYDDEEEEISKIDERTFLLDGATNIEEVGELTGVELPEGDYETVAGFVISQLDFLPQEGEYPVAEYENLRFTVEEVEERRISAIKVEILPSGEQNAKTGRDMA